MPATTARGNAVHAAHTLEAIQQRIEQHVQRLNQWESQFQQWKASWQEREVRLDRELALLEAAASPGRTAISRQLVVVRDDEQE
jgi:hypothetical protein